MSFNDYYNYRADCLYAFQWGGETRIAGQVYGKTEENLSTECFMDAMGHNMEFLYFYNCGLFNMPELCWDAYTGKGKR